MQIVYIKSPCSFFQHGFTLIEMLITLAIAGIILSSAIPAFANMHARNQLTTQLYNLFSHHQLARTEAIKTNQRVIVCKSSDGLNCTRDSQWHDGWIIFTDSNHNNKIDEHERMIHIQQALPENVTVTFSAFRSDNYITYFPGGYSTTNGTFTLCNQYGEKSAKSIIISRSGRARMDNKTSRGRPLECI